MSARAILGIVPGLLIALATSGSIKAQEPGTSGTPKSASSKSRDAQEDTARAITRLVEQLKQHPVQPKGAPDRVGLYMMEVISGEVTLIADQPAPGLTQCGSPVWSHDGRRILFDATPGTQWSLTRLESIDLDHGRLTVTDLGAGNCPSFSPTDDRIAFLSNADGAQNGVWMMNADGSDRRLLGDYGIPRWSPDGRQLMIVTFGNPRQVTIMDADPRKSGVLHIPDHQIYSVPSWVGARTIVAAIVSDEGDALALIDVSDPSRCQVKDVLWRKADGLDIRQSYPLYSPGTRRCLFGGGGPDGMALYSVEQGKGGPAKRLGSEDYATKISSLALSPDGRYLLYSVQGPRGTPKGPAPGDRNPVKANNGAAGSEIRVR